MNLLNPPNRTVPKELKFDLSLSVGRNVWRERNLEFQRSFTKLTTFAVEHYPKGYPLLAGFQASDEAFSIYRRFDYLHARVLLDLQYEISKFEKQLSKVDEEDEQDTDGCQRLTSRGNEDQDFRDGEPNACKRRKIMAQLRELLAQYGLLDVPHDLLEKRVSNDFSQMDCF